MGKNYFQAIPIKPSYEKKLLRFTSSLGKAIGKGETIPFADNDLTYTLNLQHERIESKNIELDYEVYERTKNSSVNNTFFDVENWKDKHYASKVGFGVLGVKRRVRQNEKILYKDTLRYVFYGTVTDIVSGSHPDNEIHICPNCGADQTIADLQNGCPYCGIQYKMDDLFPKITSFYFFDQLQMTKKQVFIGWPICSVICTIGLAIFASLFKNDPIFANTIKEISRYGPIFFCILGAMYGFFLFLFMHLLFKIARAIVDLQRMGTAASRERFEARMKKITPEFSFEYFKNKAISLIKKAVYSKDESELLSYQGEKLPEEFKDIIDLNYAGILGLKGFREEDGFVTVEIKSYFDVLSVKDNKGSYTHPVYSATFKRRTDIPVDLNFSMTRIQCPTCGTSFNAMKNKFCPSCNNEYELLSDDWVMIELKKV